MFHWYTHLKFQYISLNVFCFVTSDNCYQDCAREKWGNIKLQKFIFAQIPQCTCKQLCTGCPKRLVKINLYKCIEVQRKGHPVYVKWRRVLIFVQCRSYFTKKNTKHQIFVECGEKKHSEIVTFYIKTYNNANNSPKNCISNVEGSLKMMK